MRSLSHPPNKCPETEIDRAYQHIMASYERYACGNIAPMPFTMTWEGDTWTVDITVHVPRVCEYEVTGEGDTLAAALSNTSRRFDHQSELYRNSAKDAEVFHLCY